MPQNPAAIDSLQKRLHTISDTLKAKVLVNLAQELYPIEPQKASRYAQECITLSQKIKYHWGEAMALHYLGLIAHFGGESVKSMSYYLKSLQIAEKHQLLDVFSLNLSRIANINKEEGNFAESFKLHTRAIATLRKTNHKLYLSYALNQMGLLQLTQKKYEKALAYFQEALDISSEIKDDRITAICLYYIAEVYLNQGKNITALQYYKQSDAINKKINNLLLLASTWNNIAKIHYANKAIDSCIIYSYKGLHVARRVNLKPEIKGAYEYLYLSYEYNKQIDSAFKYQKLWIGVKDSLFNEQKNKQILLLQNTYQAEKHQIEIQKQKADIERRNVIIYAFSGILFLVLVILFMLYRTIRIRVKAHRKLQKRNHEVATQKIHIEEQNQHLQLLNSEITQQKEEIEIFNNQLELLVAERTRQLIQKNSQLNEYAFFNAHKLRAPIATILGLYQVLELDLDEKERVIFLEKLRESVLLLDEMVKVSQSLLDEVEDKEKTLNL